MTVLESLARGWKVLLLVAVPLIAGVVLYTESLPATYEATTVVSFAPRLDTQVGADIVRIVVPKYQVYVQSDAVIRSAARSLHVPTSDIDGHLNAQIPQDTSTLEITVDGKQAKVVSKAVNFLAQRAVEFSKGDELLTGTTVSRAVTPTSPSGPPRRLIELAGLLAALLAGVGATLFLDRLRPVVRTAPDVVEATKFRLIGVLPSASAMRYRVGAITDRHVGPAVRNLRTQLERVGKRPTDESGRGTIVVVTSTVSGEGKTTVASLLAMASARVEQGVLIIDGDLIHPNVAAFFGVPSAPGVAQLLRGADLASDQYSYDDVMPKLTVMPTEADRDAGDLISLNMERLLGWATSRYSLVIVDAPPLLGNDSGQKLVTLADEVVMVVGRGMRMRLATEGAAVLRSLDAHVVGCVANRVRLADSYGY